MNYHATNDYPINLEYVYKMIGFAKKGNAMKTIKSNFTENEDYKVLLFPTEKQKTEESRGGHNKETVMLNVDTFKNLCMIAKTDKGKQIRKHYVKLENIYNQIIKEDIMEKQRQLED
jgi:anti-repressor protein